MKYVLKKWFSRSNLQTRVFCIIISVFLVLAPVVFGQQAASPRFSYPPGKYHKPIAVMIQCETSDAIIYYTIDGTDPLPGSPLYNGAPIVIANHASGDSVTQSPDNDPDPGDGYAPQTFISMTIKAMAVKAGVENSPVARADYVIDMVDASVNVPYDDPPAAGGTKHWLDIYQPHGRTNTPVLFFIYGGAWKEGDKNIYMELGNTFAGYYHLTTVVANYQLSADPWNAIHPTHMQDVARAFDWVCDHIIEYGGDPNRIYVCGQSAGGHLVSLLAMDDRYLQPYSLSTDRIKGVITMSGAYDLFDLVQWPDNPLGLNAVETLEYKVLCQNAFGSWEQSVLDSASPAKFANVDQPPFLIIGLEENGDFKDMPGFVAEADEFYQLIKSFNHPLVELKKLTLADIPPEIVALDFPGDTEGHYEEIYAINTRYWNSVSTQMVAGFVSNAPSVPQLEYPLAGATQISLGPVLRWHQSERVTFYHLQVATEDDFAAGIIFDSPVADTAFHLSNLLSGKVYFWRVQAQNALGWSEWSSIGSFATVNLTAVAENKNIIPAKFALCLYPNPFNSNTVINFQLPMATQVTLKVFDTLGRELVTLVDDFLDTGEHQLTFNATRLPSGIYFFHIETGSFSQIRKALLIK